MKTAKERNREYYLAHREQMIADAKAYYEANKVEITAQRAAKRAAQEGLAAARTAAWRKAHPGRDAANAREYRATNPAKVNALVARREATKLQATPSWFDEFDEFVISEAYDLSAKRTKVTGIEWHVDHQVPLRSKIVQGLHCAANIAVIPARENVSKGNRYWPGMPG